MKDSNADQNKSKGLKHEEKLGQCGRDSYVRQIFVVSAHVVWILDLIHTNISGPLSSTLCLGTC